MTANRLRHLREDYMLDKTKNSFVSGIARVKWVASFLAERTRAETEIAKKSYERSKIENKIDNLYRDIGRRVLELSEKGEADVLKDSIVHNVLGELKDMIERADNYKTRTDSINKTPA
jgi:hypothetical protein